MKRQFPGLNQAHASAGDEIPERFFLVRVEQAQYRWHSHKPYYLLRIAVLEPKQWAGRSIAGRLYCSPKTMWKLSWFLRDFGYDSELLGRDEIDEKALVGLRGVVRISQTVLHGTSLLNFEGFAPEDRWKGLCSISPENRGHSEVA